MCTLSNAHVCLLQSRARAHTRTHMSETSSDATHSADLEHCTNNNNNTLAAPDESGFAGWGLDDDAPLFDDADKREEPWPDIDAPLTPRPTRAAPAPLIATGPKDDDCGDLTEEFGEENEGDAGETDSVTSSQAEVLVTVATPGEEVEPPPVGDGGGGGGGGGGYSTLTDSEDEDADAEGLDIVVNDLTVVRTTPPQPAPAVVTTTTPPTPVVVVVVDEETRKKADMRAMAEKEKRELAALEAKKAADAAAAKAAEADAKAKRDADAVRVAKEKAERDAAALKAVQEKAARDAALAKQTADDDAKAKRNAEAERLAKEKVALDAAALKAAQDKANRDLERAYQAEAEAQRAREEAVARAEKLNPRAPPMAAPKAYGKNGRTYEPKPSPSPPSTEAIPRASVPAVVELLEKSPLPDALTPHVKPGVAVSTVQPERLRAALAQLHTYVTTPSAARTAAFDNDLFALKSYDVTSALKASVGSALNVGDNYYNGDNVGKVVGDFVPFLKQLSHVLTAFLHSQVDVPTEKRTALAMSMMANISYTLEPGEKARVAQLLSMLVVGLLINESTALSLAATIARPSTELGADGLEFDRLARLGVAHLRTFVKRITGAQVSLKDTVEQSKSMLKASQSFEAAALRLSPIGTKDGEPRRAHGIELASLLRQFALENPLNEQYKPSGSRVNQDYDELYAVKLIMQSYLVAPNAYASPALALAALDVFSGMLNGLWQVTFATLWDSAERRAVAVVWLGLLDFLTNIEAGLEKNLTKVEKVRAEKNVEAKAPTLATAAAAAAAPKSKMEQTYINRFASIDDEEDD